MSGINKDCLVSSPCSTPTMPLEQVLPAYAEAGFRKFEVFSEWAESRFDIDRSPSFYTELGQKHGIAFTSMHLPKITNMDDSLDRAIKAATFADTLGVEVVLFKADSRELYINAAARFLDETEELATIPVLQNHVGTPITTAEDYRAVINGISDSRMKTLLEVGMFHTVGVSWQQGCELLKDDFALVHLKDQIGEERVPFGEGEVDIKGLLTHLNAIGYTGNIVIELEVCREDDQRTLSLMADARKHCERIIADIS